MTWRVGDRCVLNDTASRCHGDESVIEMHPRWGRVAKFSGGKYVVCVTDDPAVSTFERLRRPPASLPPPQDHAVEGANPACSSLLRWWGFVGDRDLKPANTAEAS